MMFQRHQFTTGSPLAQPLLFTRCFPWSLLNPLVLSFVVEEADDLWESAERVE